MILKCNQQWNVWGWKGLLESYHVLLPLESHWSSSLAPCLSGDNLSRLLRTASSWVWLSPQLETSQPLWATCSSIWPPVPEMSSISVCAHCFLSCQWALFGATFPAGICAHGWDLLGAFSSPGWTFPALSLSSSIVIHRSVCGAQMCPEYNLATIILRSKCHRIKILTWERTVLNNSLHVNICFSDKSRKRCKNLRAEHHYVRIKVGWQSILRVVSWGFFASSMIM